MSRKTNLTTLRKYFFWKGVWYTDDVDTYQRLSFRDILIGKYFNGIFRRLHWIGSSPIIFTNLFNIHILECEIYFRHQYKPIFWFFHKNTFRRAYSVLKLWLWFFFLNQSKHKRAASKFSTHMRSNRAWYNTFLDSNFFNSTEYTIHLTTACALCNYEYTTHFFWRYSRQRLYDVFTLFYTLILRSCSALAYLLDSICLFSMIEHSVDFFYDAFEDRTLLPNYEFASIGVLQTALVGCYDTEICHAFDYFISNTSLTYFLQQPLNPFFDYLYSVLFRAKYNHEYFTQKSTLLAVPSRSALRRPNAVSLRSMFYIFFNNVLSSAPSIIIPWRVFAIGLPFYLNNFDSGIITKLVSYASDWYTYISYIHSFLKPFKWVRQSSLCSLWVLTKLWYTSVVHFFYRVLGTGLQMTDSISYFLSILQNLQHLHFSRFKTHRTNYFLNRYYSSIFFHFRHTNFVFLRNSFFFEIHQVSIRSFVNAVESSLEMYTQSDFLFLPSIHIGVRPFITNSKIVGDFIRFCLCTRRLTISQAYNRIRRWQSTQRAYLNRCNASVKSRRGRPSRSISGAYLRNSLAGIRITCSGPPYKAKRKTRIRYHLWLARDRFTGRMPLQSMGFSIDYYQTQARIKRATIGIKVWTLFSTYGPLEIKL